MPADDAIRRRTILVVCYGNLCRSPMAEALLRDRLGERAWKVVSAGTHAAGGDPPTEGAREAIARLAGLDISQQRSRPLTTKLIEAADQVFTMSRRQALEAAALFPEAAGRIRLLGAFAPSPHLADAPADPFGDPADELEIADPMGGEPDAYEDCLRRLLAASDAAAAWLRAGAADEAAAAKAAASWANDRR
jgi:protein-tyrosine phosphatase